MEGLQDFANAADFFDFDSDSDFTSSELYNNRQRYLLVTESSEDDGGQHLFEIEEDALMHVASDTIIDLGIIFGFSIEFMASRKKNSLSCSVSSTEDHQAVHRMAKDLVGRYSSKKGPDGGNLACVWAVRRIIQKALGRVVHKSDLTTTFENELDSCFPDDLKSEDVPPGGIIISPTTWKKVGGKVVRTGTGHVGILGEGKGNRRLVYSNSSSRANWAQNFTLGSWNARYRDKKGLRVYFYPVPYYSLLTG